MKKGPLSPPPVPPPLSLPRRSTLSNPFSRFSLWAENGAGSFFIKSETEKARTTVLAFPVFNKKKRFTRPDAHAAIRRKGFDKVESL